MSGPGESWGAVFDRAADTYEDVGVAFFDVFGRRLVEAADLQPGQHVLDVGAGRGAALIPAATAVGPTGRASGIDIAPEMVTRTAADLERHGLAHAAIAVGDAAAPPGDLRDLDALLASLVLFFLDDPAAVLTTWAGRLRPGGRLALTTFVADADDGLLDDAFAAHIPDAPPADSTAGSPDADDGAADRGSDERSSFELVRDTSWLDQAIADAGLRPRQVEVGRQPVRFADAAQLLAWSMSHGMRRAVELVPPAARDDFAAAAWEALHPGPDGGRHLHVSVRFTVAERA